MKSRLFGKVRALGLSVLCLATLFGCATSYPDLPRAELGQDFDLEHPEVWQVNDGSKYDRYAELLDSYRTRNAVPEVTNKNYTVLSLNDAMLLANLGNYAAAFEQVMTTQQVMTGKVKGELGRKILAAFASEGNKIYKGEPYEIAMANYYLGLFSLIKGDPETAGIGFRRSLEADKMSKEGYRDDFNLSTYCLGLSCREDDPETAEMALGKVNYPKGGEDFQKDNLFIFVEMGRAPWKMLYLSGALDKPMPENYEPRSAEIFIDGESIGSSFELVDLYQQASTTGRSGKDALQGAKGALKTIGKNLPLVGGLVDLAWKVNADTRSCYLLPGEVHTTSAYLAPDQLHSITVKFKDAAGQELERYEQTWHYIRTQDDQPTILTVRSEYDKCNVQAPITLTNVQSVVAEGTEAKTITFNPKVLEGEVQAGDRIRICQQVSNPRQRYDVQTHWRYAPIEFDRSGVMIQRPLGPLSINDFDLGEIGEAEVVSIEGSKATAKVVALTGDYQPNKKSLVTNAILTGRTWQVAR